MGHMKDTRSSLLDDLREMAAGARFGALRRFSPGAYQQLPEEEAKLLACLLDFADQTASSEPVFADLRAAAYRAFVVGYVEARRVDGAAAEAFYRSLSEDYPGAPDSALVHGWGELTTASLAFREVVQDPSRMSWQKCADLFQATNELLRGLLPFLVTLRRAALGLQPLGAAVFERSFAERVQDYRILTPDAASPFAVFLRLSEPEILEALGQGRARPDAEANVLRYQAGVNQAEERRFDLGDFFLIAAAGSHAQHAYLAAVSAIAVMESGSPAAQALFPAALASAFPAGPEPSKEDGPR